MVTASATATVNAHPSEKWSHRPFRGVQKPISAAEATCWHSLNESEERCKFWTAITPSGSSAQLLMDDSLAHYFSTHGMIDRSPHLSGE